MTEEQKILLTKIATLQLNILDNDQVNAIKLAKEINSMELNEEQKSNISNSISDLTNNNNDINFMLNLVREFTFLNFKYYEFMIMSKNIDTREEMISILNSYVGLSITNLSPIEEYNYYNTLINFAILSKQRDKIELLIDKIQLL